MNKRLLPFIIFFWALLLYFFLKEVYFEAFTQKEGLIMAFKSIAMNTQKVLLGYGFATYIFFILLYALRPLFFFPASIMTLTSVFFFGPFVAFFISYIGETCAACVAYTLGRYFGNELGITQAVSKTKIYEYLKGNAFMCVFLLRIVPLFPFDMVNYSSGVAKLPFRDYIGATLLGILPGLAAFIFLGNSFFHPEQLPYAIAFVILLAITSVQIKKRFEVRKH